MEKICSVIILFACVYLTCVSAVDIKNVLVIDTVPSPSHQIWMKALSAGLGQHGFNVTVLSIPTISKDAPKNVTYMYMDELWELMKGGANDDFLDSPDTNTYVKLFTFIPKYKARDEVALNSTAFKALLNYPKDFKFDLIIFDYMSAFALLSLKEVFNNPPLIAVSAYPGIGITNMMTRGPEFFSFVPHIVKDVLEDTFVDRLDNFVVTSLNTIIEQFYVLPTSTKTVRKVLPNQVQTANELFLSASIQLVNYHPVINKAQPIMPSVIPVGGLQIAAPKPLPKDLEEIYAKKSKGTVLFSLGSNVKSEDLGKQRLTEIIGALRKLPEYNFIWKIDLKGLDLEIPKNVFIKKWLPQNDMLADNRTVLFISHAGGLSTQECTWFGVPMLALPVMFDQFPNAAEVVKMGMGLKLAIRDMTKDEFKSTILELLTNTVYSEKAKLMSRNYRDQPQQPMERALWWIDYVLRNPDVTFLQNSKLKEMSFLVKHSIDIIVFLTVIPLVLLFIIFKVAVCLFKKNMNSNKKLKKQ